MTNSQVKELRKGDEVHEEHGLVCLPLRVLADARINAAATYWRAFAVSSKGALVVGVTHHGSFHLAAECGRTTATGTR